MANPPPISQSLGYTSQPDSWNNHISLRGKTPPLRNTPHVHANKQTRWVKNEIPNMFKVQPEFLFVNKSHHITVQNNPCIFLQRRQLELFVHVLVLAVLFFLSTKTFGLKIQIYCPSWHATRLMRTKVHFWSNSYRRAVLPSSWTHLALFRKGRDVFQLLATCLY